MSLTTTTPGTLSLSETMPPPVISSSERLAYSQGDGGEFILHAAPDLVAAEAAFKPMAEADRNALLAAIEKARQLPECIEAARLAALIDDVSTKRTKAWAEAESAEQLARECILRADDPAIHEQEEAEQRKTVERLAIRLGHLESQYLDANRGANRVTEAAVTAVWQSLQEAHTKSRADLLAQIEEALSPLLSRLLAVDESHAGLFGPGGRLPHIVAETLHNRELSRT
jgi:hypothetical protein